MAVVRDKNSDASDKCVHKHALTTRYFFFCYDWTTVVICLSLFDKLLVVYREINIEISVNL